VRIRVSTTLVMQPCIYRRCNIRTEHTPPRHAHHTVVLDAGTPRDDFTCHYTPHPHRPPYLWTNMTTDVDRTGAPHYRAATHNHHTPWTVGRVDGLPRWFPLPHLPSRLVDGFMTVTAHPTTLGIRQFDAQVGATTSWFGHCKLWKITQWRQLRFP